METLPDVLVVTISEFLADPADVARLSECNHRCRRILPVPPLRVRIQAFSTGTCMPQSFFLSPANNPARILRTTDSILFGEHYLFWTFDRTKYHCRAYLERNARIGKRPERAWDETGFLLGLCPLITNQTWQVYSPASYAGEAVPWNAPVGLLVGGKDSNKRQPDSTERRHLSNSITKPYWHVTSKEWGDSEQIQLIPQHDGATIAQRVQGNLSIHAIADVDDAGVYRLYSPEAAKCGSIAYEGVAATIPLEFWTQDSYMYFFNSNVPLTLGIPILEEDGIKEKNQAAPLKWLLVNNSARWDAFKYFIATVADVLEGSSAFTLDRFCEGARTRDDLIFEKDNELVSLKYQDMVLDRNALGFARNAAQVWHAVICD